MGTLIGVLFIGESIAAPAATGMGILLAYAGFVPLQELLVAQGNGATRTGHLTLVSPAVLLKNAFGFTLAVGSIPATTARTWISLVAVIIIAFTLAVWTLPPYSGCRDLGSQPQATLDHRARHPCHHRASRCVGGHQIRQARSPRHQRSVDSTALRSRWQHPRFDTAWRPATCPLLQHYPQSR